MEERHHAVIVVAEGAGQDLCPCSDARDASGNVRLQDIGPFLKQQINEYFAANGPKVELKYIDPSYVVRSVPANAEDDVLCDQFARHAVHAAMAGKTDLMIGQVSGHFVHVPLDMATGKKRRVKLEGELWTAVLATTGQPERWT
jgi:6-phosphofructokinase 1